MRSLLALLLLSAFLAGCAGGNETGNDSDDGGRIGNPGGDQAWDQATNASFPGLILEGTLDGVNADGNAAIVASIRNEGDEEYKVSGICVEAWRESMLRGGQEVQHREPMFHCEAFGLKAFEDETRTYEWNRTLFHEAADGSGRGDFLPAQDGVYTWRIHFDVYRGGEESYEFEDFTTLTIEFQVTV